MFKKEIMLLHSKLKERHSYPEIGFLERPGSKDVSNSSLDPFPMGEAFQGRSFSLKRVSQPQNLSTSRQIILGNVSKQIEMRTARK